MKIENNVLYKYDNGNTSVTILKNGTKIRECSESTPYSQFPETIDVKITNFCNIGCSFCHEMSTTKGAHCDIDVLIECLNVLPKGIELAIGGGDPLSHPELSRMLIELKEKGFICNITVNQNTLKENIGLVEKLVSEELVYGIGVSITDFDDLDNIVELQSITDHIVFHVIVGVHQPSDISKLYLLKYCKILLLGYKVFGRGVNHSVDIEVESNKWYQSVNSITEHAVMSFDNLAIEQLDLKRLFTDESWDKFYMGNDFTHSMYIDAVKQEYANTSRSKDRVSFADMGLIEYFKNGKRD